MEEEGREDTLATKQSWSVDESLRLVVVAMAMAMAMEVAFASGTHGHDTRERGERREAANNNKKRAPAAPQRKSSLFLWPLAPKANRYRALRARREPYSPRRAPAPSPICSPQSLASPALLPSALVPCCHHNRYLFPTNDGLGRTARGPSGLPTFTPLCRDW